MTRSDTFKSLVASALESVEAAITSLESADNLATSAGGHDEDKRTILARCLSDAYATRSRLQNPSGVLTELLHHDK